MKALIDVPRPIWGKVKNFATVKDIPLSYAVEKLLAEALAHTGDFLDSSEGTKN